jgi:PAS domain S-box-containing protein
VTSVQSSVIPEFSIVLTDKAFRQIVEHSLIGTLIVDDRTIVYASPACEEIFGRSSGELTGIAIDSIIRSDDRKDGDSSLWRRLDAANPSVFYSHRCIRPNGAVRDLETQSAWRVIDDRAVEVLSIVDVTTRNERVRHAAATMVDEWRRTFDAVNTPIVITKNDGTIVRANRVACELAGLPEIELIGRSVASLGGGEPWATAGRLVAEVAGDTVNVSAETGDDVGRTWDVNIAQFADERDQTVRYILVFWNITGTVELQESLRRSETISAMGKIVAGVAHEVRNPLFGISATLDAFAEELNRPGYAECAAALSGEVKRLTKLMQDLLEYGKPTALHIEHIDLRDLINEIIGSLGPVGVLVENAVPPRLPRLLLDRSRIRQVFLNLIENAGQRALPNSVVQVIGSVVEHGGRQWIECRVEDSGCGIAPEDLERVFDPFFTRREGGTGLGLSIVQRIIHDHLGKVFAGNRPGGGAVIRILFPFTDPQE